MSQKAFSLNFLSSKLKMKMKLPPTYEQTAGFVYLLSNPSMPNIVKIGSTERTIKERISELSSVTSLPTPFVVGYYLLVLKQMQ